MLSQEDFTKLYTEYKKWAEDASNQTDGYTYEKSFDEFIHRLGKQLFEQTVSAGENVPERQKKKVITKYGKISVDKSHILSPPAGRTGFKISPYLQELGCYVGQSVPFDEGSELLKKLSHTELSDKQIERLSHFYGSAIEQIEIEQTSETTSPVIVNHEENQANELHYTMVDGSMIYTREEGWKEIKLGRIFSNSSILPFKNRNEIASSQYLAHLGSSHEFLDKFEKHMDNYSNVVAIADGATWIWNYFETHRPDVVQILDFYHAVEKLGDFAKAYFKDKKQEEQKQWLEVQKERLMNDKVEEIIQIVEQMECQVKAIGFQNALLTYYRNNKSRMMYGTFRAKGYLIGSGPIEAAHRNVIQQRLKLAGQRWTKKGAQQVANLRVAHKSNDWNLVIKSIKFYRAA